MDLRVVRWCQWNTGGGKYFLPKEIRFWPDLVKNPNSLNVKGSLSCSFSSFLPRLYFIIIIKEFACLFWTSRAFGTCLTSPFNRACQNVNEDSPKSASRLNKVIISCRSKFSNLFTWHVSTFPATLPQFLFLSSDRACLVGFCLIFFFFF